MTKLQQCLNKCSSMGIEALKEYRTIVSMSNCKRTDKELIYECIDKRLNRPSALVEMGENCGEVD